ncbi:MAG: baeRF10 domain-containing protein [Solirubrobacteraceae bacterium]
MSATATAARSMLERTGQHPVVSLFMDLDPARFATGAARATQLRSLLDEAGRDRTWSSHEDRVALNDDLERLERYLESDGVPVSGARSLAVFCSSRDDLFEAIALHDAVDARVVIASQPCVEPLVAARLPDRWCVALVSRRDGAILSGDPAGLSEHERVTDDVHGRHSQGGWSQANYERSVENEAEQHFRRLATEVYRVWQREQFERLVLAGPREDLDRFEQLLHNDLRPALVPRRLALEAETASANDVRAALRPLLESERQAGRQAALAQLRERLEAGGAATAGLAGTLAALGERRVQRLLLASSFRSPGRRCPSCGLLSGDDAQTCPVDGAGLEHVADLRAAAVACAVRQDAEVTVLGEGSEPPPAPLHPDGIAALLRF